MGIIVVSLMQILHILLIYIIIAKLIVQANLISKSDLKPIMFVVLTIIILLNGYRYNKVKTYESMHADWLNETNSGMNNKGWGLVLYILLNFSVTLFFGIIK